MKVLFVYPDNTRGRFKPINIGILSTIAMNAGHEVRVFDQSDYIFDLPSADAGVNLLMFKRFKYPEQLRYVPEKTLKDGLKEVVADFSPDILAFSVTYLTFDSARDLVRLLGENRVPTIFGGVHVTLNPEEVISYDEVDMICRGEGEEAFVELLNRMENGEDISNIPNIWTKKNGRVFQNSMRPLRKGLDDLPLPDWSLYPDHHFYKPYVGEVYRIGDVMVSRGCYNNCSYCFYHAYYTAYGTRKHRVVFMSPERAIAEVDHYIKKFGAEMIRFRDSDFTARPVEQIREMARLSHDLGPHRPRMLCNVDHRSVTREKVRLLREMNIVSVTMGLESGSRDLLESHLGRKASLERFYRAAGWFRENGIRLCTGNMIGLPAETRKNIFETIEVNQKAKVDVADVSFLFPFSGTRINEICKELGFLKKDPRVEIYHRAEPVMDMPQLSKSEQKSLMNTFHLYLHAPHWFYPFIHPAEKDSPLGKRYLRFLRKIFYPYIFYIKMPLRQFWRSLKNGDDNNRE